MAFVAGSVRGGLYSWRVVFVAAVFIREVVRSERSWQWRFIGLDPHLELPSKAGYWHCSFAPGTIASIADIVIQVLLLSLLLLCFEVCASKFGITDWRAVSSKAACLSERILHCSSLFIHLALSKTILPWFAISFVDEASISTFSRSFID